MDIRRSALIAALATTVVWTLKAVAIGTAGGEGRSPLEGPLFLIGLGLCVLTSALLGLALTTRRRIAGKIIGVLLAAVIVIGFAAADNLVVDAFAPAHHSWVWDEVNLWVLMVLLVAVAGVLVSRSRTTRLEVVAVD